MRLKTGLQGTTERRGRQRCVETYFRQHPCSFVVLDPETSPEAIREEHRELIRRARRFVTSPEAISDAVDLPLCIVIRHLVEMKFMSPNGVLQWWWPVCERKKYRIRAERKLTEA